MGLLITLLLGIFFIVGYFLVKFGKNTKAVETLSISVALGTMVCLVIFDLIPEMFEHLDGISIFFMILLVLLGAVFLKILDLFVPDHDHDVSLHHDCSEDNLLHIGIVSLVAIVLHNIIEGMAVYSLVVEDVRTGLLVALGVGLHNIPMGMVISSTLEPEPRRKQVLSIVVAMLSTFFGGLIMMLVHSVISDFFIGCLICITLGMILYIVLFELIPHTLHSENKKLSLVGIIIGVLIILITTLFE